ncbi:hypothetical protein LEN26_013911 [Aphanomyces euteiches]|nr:hypothetical protein LEN26_013911 [Aphanomyces euteiches]
MAVDQRPEVHFETRQAMTTAAIATSPSALKCAFCNLPSVFDGKCSRHRYRLHCQVASCPNQAYARNLCVQHGGKRRCRFDGCHGNARSYGFCCKHGPRVRKLCRTDGCKNVAQARDLCVKHGGGRQCKWDGCLQYARSEGFCQSHFRECSKSFNSTSSDSSRFSDDEAEMLLFFFKDEPTLSITSGLDEPRSPMWAFKEPATELSNVWETVTL